ncbi:MAG: outer membrane protein assembly factor BamD [Pirellulaceae bacterium]|nr:outer membrane protein assembly factor BamD [Pirellulaceae bacterium]
MKKTFVVICTSWVLVFCSGCGIFRSVGDGTQGIMNKMISSGAQRRSVLDEIEKNEPEFLLDSMVRQTASKKDGIVQQNQERALTLYNEAEELYQQAIQARQASEGSADHAELFKSAAKQYLRSADQWINSAHEQDAVFKAGEAFFFADHYKKANDLFERLVKDYPGTRHMDVVMVRRFSIAKFWLELSKSNPQNFLIANYSDESRPMRDAAGNAIRILDRMRIDDPTGKLADDATIALANAYFEQERYLDAADTYEDLRVNFPSSQHQFHSHLSEMKARLMAYQGPHYDGTHLETAQKLIKAILTQFPHEADEHKELLTRENARVRKMVAERQLALASYYEARGAYEAAEMQYQQVLREFGQTPIADTAKNRMDAISDKSTNSGEPAEWIARLFPESKPVEPLFGTRLKDQIR